MREVRQTHFAQTLASKLHVEGAILVALAAALSLTMGVGGGSGSSGASTGLVMPGAASALVGAGVTAHAGVGLYRLGSEPLTERAALALITVEDAASYLGIASGGLVVAGTVLAVGVEFLGGASPASGSVALQAPSSGRRPWPVCRWPRRVTSRADSPWSS